MSETAAFREAGAAKSGHNGPALANPLAGSRTDIVSVSGRIATYAAGQNPEGENAPPLLLIHSINAAGSAFEVKPLYDFYSGKRRVFALDLPGFGQSERSDHAYTVRTMTDAVHAAVEKLREAHGGAPIDALALSLSCEFLARAALETPDAFRSLGFISPTGFEGKARDDVTHGTLGKRWLLDGLKATSWKRGVFGLLTFRPVMRKFLESAWGSKTIDEPLLDYDYITAHQPGAEHAAFYFVAGYMFSKDILRIYQALKMPVWMSHGTKGSFTDYRHKKRVTNRLNWTIDVFEAGAFPHFEVLGQVTNAYDAFLAKVGQVSRRVVVPNPV
ncbi:pimeloyl-ACP methyl ester carboxylesterase [Rhodopseudomonas rhenobacensis]|uniref:Pimeloyl-ACP methyl ester carboxylesterase n=1 Tax=Rhodopseudomonas rhenobacensis TaxID=87461 RepID=A0A7W7Z0F6_9BRAD|nr:alpha/beta hydrolase [Rhodopseudomonas rhenobacensis]MBB5045614.1 pimeloyl-ACP methyl ester carboxylesterase [Rhodopseudomonas rhenobacensis]